MDLAELVVSDPEVMSGVPCFRGARVPVALLFENLGAGMTVDEVPETWPSLNREDVFAVLRLARTNGSFGTWLVTSAGRVLDDFELPIGRIPEDDDDEP